MWSNFYFYTLKWCHSPFTFIHWIFNWPFCEGAAVRSVFSSSAFHRMGGWCMNESSNHECTKSWSADMSRSPCICCPVWQGHTALCVPPYSIRWVGGRSFSLSFCRTKPWRLILHGGVGLSRVGAAFYSRHSWFGQCVMSLFRPGHSNVDCEEASSAHLFTISMASLKAYLCYQCGVGLFLSWKLITMQFFVKLYWCNF